MPRRLTRFVAALLAALVVVTTPGEAAFRAAGQIASAPLGAPAAVPSLGSLPVAPSGGLPSIPALNMLPGLPGTVAVPGSPVAGAPIPALSASTPDGPKAGPSAAPSASGPEAAKPASAEGEKPSAQ